MKERKFKPGQRLWKFDVNLRVYPRDAAGKPVGGGPIYAEHFEEYRVCRLEPRSYVIGRADQRDQGATFCDKAFSFSKAEGMFRTDDEKASEVFLNDYAYRIGEALGRSKNVELITRVGIELGLLAARSPDPEATEPK